MPTSQQKAVSKGKPDDTRVHRKLCREFSRSLSGLRAQALWLGLPDAAHFIDVAQLTALEAERRSRTESDEPRP
jgi:hypothetical protein